MNQAIIFNDDLMFNDEHQAWCISGLIMGQTTTIFFHSLSLSRLSQIDRCTQYDLEEIAELWLEKNEPDGNSIHINMKA